MRCPHVSVIVPIFNHWTLVPALLDALQKQILNKDAFELLLVDNGSDCIPDNLDLPDWARILFCDTPGSYAARNVGVRSAQGMLLAFTDADCLPSPAWLQHGLSLSRSGRNGASMLIAGGVQIEPVDWACMTESEAFDVVMGLPQERYVSHGYAVTANLFVSAATFEQVGLFDEKRFSGGDAEFCRRAGSHGWRMVFCPEAQVVHPARREWRELKTKQRRVKGGQLAAGPIRRRLMYGVATLMPPLRQCYFALSSNRLALAGRLKVCVVLFRLWGVSLAEMLRIVSGGRPERR
jgi:hypothetical protein